MNRSYSKYPVTRCEEKLSYFTSFSKFLDLTDVIPSAGYRWKTERVGDFRPACPHTERSDVIRGADRSKPCGDMQAEYERGIIIW